MQLNLYHSIHLTKKNVDASYSTNPTIDDSIFPNVKIYSIFKRKNNSHGDGNPLIYALKNENGLSTVELKSIKN